MADSVDLSQSAMRAGGSGTDLAEPGGEIEVRKGRISSEKQFLEDCMEAIS